MMILNRFRRFARAKSGVAAVEFALLAPMMMFLLFGSIDLIDALSTTKRVEVTTVSLADVVSRDTEIDDDEVDGLWDAANMLMFPDTAQTMAMRVTSVRIESSTSARVVWSEGRNAFAPRGAGTSVTLPSAMMTPGTSLIMTETRYRYDPPVGFLFIGGMNMEHTAYRRSRLVDPIPRV